MDLGSKRPKLINHYTNEYNFFSLIKYLKIPRKFLYSVKLKQHLFDAKSASKQTWDWTSASLRILFSNFSTQACSLYMLPEATRSISLAVWNFKKVCCQTDSYSNTIILYLTY